MYLQITIDIILFLQLISPPSIELRSQGGADYGYIIGRKVGLPDGASITIDLTGPIDRMFHVVVDGRAAQVEVLESPDVTVHTDSTTFALLACGRIDPQGPIDDGRISWEGDAEFGERAARNLAFTM